MGRRRLTGTSNGSIKNAHSLLAVLIGHFHNKNGTFYLADQSASLKLLGHKYYSPSLPVAGKNKNRRYLPAMKYDGERQ